MASHSRLPLQADLQQVLFDQHTLVCNCLAALMYDKPGRHCRLLCDDLRIWVFARLSLLLKYTTCTLHGILLMLDVIGLQASKAKGATGGSSLCIITC